MFSSLPRSILLATLLACSITSFSQKIPKQLEYEAIELIDGTTIASSQLQDKIIVANLWGTWCKPCVKEIPDLNELVEMYKDNDQVIFLAVADPGLDTTEKISAFLEKREFAFSHMKPERESMFFRLGGTIVFPTTVVYDKTGRLKKKYKGDLQPEDLESLPSLIDKLIAE